MTPHILHWVSTPSNPTEQTSSHTDLEAAIVAEAVLAPSFVDETTFAVWIEDGTTVFHRTEKLA